MPFPEGALILGEVTRVMTREQLDVMDAASPEHRSERRRWMQESGLTEADVEAGRVVTIRRGLYWNNTASGIKRSTGGVALLAPGMRAEVGNVLDETPASGPDPR
ncbi:MAG: hypothetical protein ACM3N6_00430 [Betaproteobacteria bacterium]